MDLEQYIGIFIDEAKEHLLKLNEYLLNLEKDMDNLKIISEIFRSAHTLKGSAATMGYENMAALTHEMENLLDLIRNNKLKVDSEIIDIIFSCLDLLEKMVNSINNSGGDDIETTEIISKLKNASNRVSLPVNDNRKNGYTKNSLEISFDQYERTVLLQSIENGFHVYRIYVKIDNEAVLKSVRVFMVLNETEKFGEVFKTLPDVEVLESEDFGSEFSYVVITNEKLETIKNAISNISEITEVNFVNVIKEELKEDKRTESESNKDEIKNIKDDLNNSSAKVTNKMVRVDIDRLDELMNLFSELIIDRGRLEELSSELKDSGLNDTIDHMSRITTDLQNNILNLRMVPIEQVFNRFPRMIRDLAKELDKKVDLKILGAETELDRTVIDEIGDPLVHLLRNAVDHGLESTAERVKNNKSETGVVTLRAYHSGNYVFIEIGDDGNGIDRDKVINKAIEKKLITPEAAQGLTDRQVNSLLFQSGFSTADKITDVSGRGVGLDVVKAKIESLGGAINIDATLHKGSIFIIQLPLTLSIISAMLVQVNDEKFAIPLSSVIETTVYKKSDILYAQKQEVIDYRGKIVPLVYLEKIFEIPRVNEDKNEDEISVVLVKKREEIAAIVVDSLIGQQEIVLKSLGSYLSKKVFAILGGTILGDGRVALIIDANALIK